MEPIKDSGTSIIRDRKRRAGNCVKTWTSCEDRDQQALTIRLIGSIRSVHRPVPVEECINV